ncbi:MAG: ATP-grasp domain-containing protein [Bacteroidota bacterium]
MAEQFDIGLAWDWEFDRDFIYGIENECISVGLSTFRIEPNNVEAVTRMVRSRKISFNVLLDRASDSDDNFIPLARTLTRARTKILNEYANVEYAKDKANMHLALMGEGINVPYTIIISPYNKRQEVELSLTELAHLGRPFIIKPANTTGGGIGVVLGAETLKEIIESRKFHKNDTYLLQETVHPAMLGSMIGWFRVFYAFGATIVCWWDHRTHIYREMTKQEIRKYKLQKLHAMILTIHKICRLDFFSSEITITENGKFIAVDYVNEICDMRLQSKHADGVPDAIVAQIQRQFAKFVRSHLKKSA